MKTKEKRRELIKKANQKPTVTDWIVAICAIVTVLVEVISFIRN